MAVGYRTTPLTTHLGIEDRDDITEEELYNSVAYTVAEINKIAPTLERDEDGVSISPYTLSETASLISYTYGVVGEEYPFFTNTPS